MNGEPPLISFSDYDIFLLKRGLLLLLERNPNEGVKAKSCLLNYEKIEYKNVFSKLF